MRLKLTSICALAMLLISSCATFKGNDLPNIDHFQSSASPKRALLVELSQNRNSMGAVVVETKYGRKDVRDMFKKTLDDSGYFSEVVVRDSEVMREFNNDYTLKISVNYQDDGNTGTFLWAVLSGCTLDFIPFWHRQNYILKAQLLDKNAKQVAYFELMEHSTYVAQTLMLFVMPFHFSPTVQDEITENLAKKTSGEVTHVA
jgi:hypothetical protein